MLCVFVVKELLENKPQRHRGRRGCTEKTDFSDLKDGSAKTSLFSIATEPVVRDELLEQWVLNIPVQLLQYEQVLLWNMTSANLTGVASW